METKKCTRCKETKEVSFFNKSAYRKEGTRAHCKECEREQAREFYKKNSQPYKDRAKQGKKVMKERLNAFLFNLKEKSGCVICPEKEVACLDFHHIIKGKPVTRMTSTSYSALENELNKCIIVCCNCHRKIHAKLIAVNETMIKPINLSVLLSKL